MFPVILISSSASSSSDTSLDDPLIVGLTGTAGFFCREGEQGTPVGALASLFCNLEGSFPKGPEHAQEIKRLNL